MECFTKKLPVDPIHWSLYTEQITTPLVRTSPDKEVTLQHDTAVRNNLIPRFFGARMVRLNSHHCHYNLTDLFEQNWTKRIMCSWEIRYLTSLEHCRETSGSDITISACRILPDLCQKNVCVNNPSEVKYSKYIVVNTESSTSHALVKWAFQLFLSFKFLLPQMFLSFYYVSCVLHVSPI
jgi:hypothetical protein